MKYLVTYEILGVEDYFYIEGDDITGVEEYLNLLLEEMNASLIKMEEI